MVISLLHEQEEDGKGRAEAEGNGKGRAEAEGNGKGLSGENK
jgi:hypothetical protein